MAKGKQAQMPFASKEKQREYDLNRRLTRPDALKEPKARYYASKRSILRVQNILWRLQHGHGVRQATLDKYGLVQHLARPARPICHKKMNCIIHDHCHRPQAVC